MCVLCWQFLTETHWTDRRSDTTATATTGSAGSDDERARRCDRHQRVRVLNRILSCYGLQLDDWQSRSYVLSDRRGKTVMVPDLGALWPAAQQLAGRCLDPLNPWLLAGLEAHDVATKPMPDASTRKAMQRFYLRSCLTPPNMSW